MAKRKNDNKKVLDASLVRAVSKVNGHIQGAFRAVLSATIEDAVANHNFDNRTWNLEGSYGWAIYHNGAMVESEIEGDSDGAKRAGDILESYSPSHTWEGVVIAGAEYAYDVEEYVRKHDGILSKAGDELFVLGKFFDLHRDSFVGTLKSIAKL